jgi:hypothetical protein
MSNGGDAGAAAAQIKTSKGHPVTGPAAERPAAASQLKLAADSAVILGGLAFLTGWSYLSAYYEAFGVSLFQLDISFATGAVYAVKVFYRSAWLLMVCAVFAAMWFGIWRFLLPRLTSTPRMAILRVAPALKLAFAGASLLILAAVGARTGKMAAREDLFAESSRLPPVAFISTLKTDYELPACVATNSLDCRLLVNSKGLYYFFEPIPGPPTGADSPSNIQLYAVPENAVQVVRVQRGFE